MAISYKMTIVPAFKDRLEMCYNYSIYNNYTWAWFIIIYDAGAYVAYIRLESEVLMYKAFSDNN